LILTFSKQQANHHFLNSQLIILTQSEIPLLNSSKIPLKEFDLLISINYLQAVDPLLLLAFDLCSIFRERLVSFILVHLHQRNQRQIHHQKLFVL